MGPSEIARRPHPFASSAGLTSARRKSRARAHRLAWGTLAPLCSRSLSSDSAFGKAKFANVGKAFGHLPRIQKRRVLLREKTEGLDNFVCTALAAWFELAENLDCPLRIIGEKQTRRRGDPGDNGFFGSLGRRQNALALKLREASSVKLFPAQKANQGANLLRTAAGGQRLQWPCDTPRARCRAASPRTGGRNPSRVGSGSVSNSSSNAAHQTGLIWAIGSSKAPPSTTEFVARKVAHHAADKFTYFFRRFELVNDLAGHRPAKLGPLSFRGLEVGVEGRSRLDADFIMGKRSQNTRYSEFERVRHLRHARGGTLCAQASSGSYSQRFRRMFAELQQQNRLVPVRCHHSFDKSHSFQTIRTPSLLITRR